ncbi:MAG: CDP-alcohol phosphatidyltransferase family protein [Candidatus Brocadiaceae bacterium]
MASVYDLKPYFQNLLRPVTRFLALKGITANQVTLTAMMLSFATGGLVYWRVESRWSLLLIPIILLIRMALNAIDGMLAREHNMKTPLGAILNELGDVLSDSTLYLPLAFFPNIPCVLIVCVVILAIITEMAGVVSIQFGASRRYDGPMGKSDRAFVFGLVTLLLGLGFQSGVWLKVVFGLMVFLLILTIFNRSRKALQELKS